MKIVPSGLIDTITQSAGGITIQNSYGGLQVHLKARQTKKKTVGQQRARAAFTNVQSSWGDLSPEEQETWNTAAGPGQSGFELYSSTNNKAVNQGLNIIPEKIAPVDPPTNDLVFSSESYVLTPGEREYDAIFVSPGANIPTSGWSPYVQWTGWILPSQYRFPEMRYKTAYPATEIINSENLRINVEEAFGSNMNNMIMGSKANFDVGIINNTTGQIFSYMIWNAVITP